MSLNSTPNANRLHIGFFGVTNSGKSSIVNAITNQQLAIVSDTKGTTTDPVYKAMELLPLGAVTIIDTAGIDDISELGSLRVQKTNQVINKTDIAVLVTEAFRSLLPCELELIRTFKDKHIPYCIAYNKADLLTDTIDTPKDGVLVSGLNRQNIEALKEYIAHLVPTDDGSVKLVADLIQPNDFVVLVTPIDQSAPKGRLILPQQQTIRDVLEADATAIVVKEFQLKDTLNSLNKKPTLVVTDSQVFAKVSADTPADIKLTSFSILMARYKGLLDTAVRGVKTLDTLENGDTILIAEACTHHRQCNDIGTVKLPNWIKDYTKKDIHFEFCSGTQFPQVLTPYKLIVHCGGCMITPREVKYRMQCALQQNVPITNYGTTIAYIHGILKRSLEVFPELLKVIQ